MAALVCLLCYSTAVQKQSIADQAPQLISESEVGMCELSCEIVSRTCRRQDQELGDPDLKDLRNAVDAT